MSCQACLRCSSYKSLRRLSVSSVMGSSHWWFDRTVQPFVVAFSKAQEFSKTFAGCPPRFGFLCLVVQPHRSLSINVPKNTVVAIWVSGHPSVWMSLAAALVLIVAAAFRELTREYKPCHFAPRKSYKRHPNDDSSTNFYSEPNSVHFYSAFFGWYEPIVTPVSLSLSHQRCTILRYQGCSAQG